MPLYTPAAAAAGSSPVIVRKTADQSTTTGSTALTGMSIPMLASSYYAYEMMLLISGTSAEYGQVYFNPPAGTTEVTGCIYINNSSVLVATQWIGSNIGLSSTVRPLWAAGTFATSGTAGNLDMYFGPVSGTVTFTIKAGSYLSLTKI